MPHRKRLPETVSSFEVLQHELREAEARQAQVELSQPEEKKELAKIKENIRTVSEQRSELQKGFGRLEAQIEIAQAQPEASPASAGGATGDRNRKIENDAELEKFIDLIKKMKTELTIALSTRIRANCRPSLKLLLRKLILPSKRLNGAKPGEARQKQKWKMKIVMKVLA